MKACKTLVELATTHAFRVIKAFMLQFFLLFSTAASLGECTKINFCERERPCMNSLCEPITGDYLCTCDDGYTGKNCQHNIDDCDPNPCKNGGTCKDDVDTYICQCVDGYSGESLLPTICFFFYQQLGSMVVDSFLIMIHLEKGFR